MSRNYLPHDKEFKYNHCGVYCVYIEDKLVYIGKSKLMKRRVLNHIRCIQDPERHKVTSPHGHNKYQVLHEAYENGLSISFDVIKYCSNDEEALKWESFFIRKYLPPLNYAIPDESGRNTVEHNELAEEVTLDEILSFDSIKIPSAFEQVS